MEGFDFRLRCQTPQAHLHGAGSGRRARAPEGCGAKCLPTGRSPIDLIDQHRAGSRADKLGVITEMLSRQRSLLKTFLGESSLHTDSVIQHEKQSSLHVTYCFKQRSLAPTKQRETEQAWWVLFRQQDWTAGHSSVTPVFFQPVTLFSYRTVTKQGQKEK